MDAEQLWQTAQGELQIQMPRTTYDTWLRNTEAVSLDGNILTIAVNNPFVKDWLENRLIGTVQRTVKGILGDDVELRFVLESQAQPEEAEAPLLRQPEKEEVRKEPVKPERAVRSGTPLNPLYVFDDFIEGPSNRFAHAACQAVAARDPGAAYNPLFIWGGVGLGKTHLIQAVGHVLLSRGFKVLYVSSEEFTNDLINSIRMRATEDFRAKYRNIDVLMIDDIQFIAGKESTQEEFFHTFNTLYAANNKQIIISSDRPPKAIPTLETRLSSRFEGGLTTDIQPPDLEERIAILRFKVSKQKDQSITVPDEVINYIASKVQSNIRELVGALTKVVAKATLLRTPLTVTLAEQALSDVVDHTVSVDIGQVVEAVANYYRVPSEAILGRSRRQDVSMPRQIVMYLARTETGLSLPQIGEALGGRDHTTILYANEKITDLIESDQQLRREVMSIRDALYNNNNRK